jgi:secondary thiamine-phosphate synthase enzyme
MLLLYVWNTSATDIKNEIFQLVAKKMTIKISHLSSETTQGTDIIDLTPQVINEVSTSEIFNGGVTLFVPGSTAALTTIEYESGVLRDLKDAIERMAPQDLVYEHDRRWGDGNGYSHVRAALVGPSLQIPLVEGDLLLGTWQQVVLIDFDNRPRIRKIVMQVQGE